MPCQQKVGGILCRLGRRRFQLAFQGGRIEPLTAVGCAHGINHSPGYAHRQHHHGAVGRHDVDAVGVIATDIDVGAIPESYAETCIDIPWFGPLALSVGGLDYEDRLRRVVQDLARAERPCWRKECTVPVSRT